MSAQYIVRFDDICPTMNWEIWNQIERILIDSDIRPILAVVPDNQDPKLRVAPAQADFWNRVRQWQARGWSIGLHGYQHKYVTRDPGIVGLNRRSEFAGVRSEEQEACLRQGVEIFRAEGLEADLWVAPAHSFDWVTVAVLKKLGIRVISDGFFLYPRVDAQGLIWVPQQIWQFRPRMLGVWTICFHHNHWGPGEVARLRDDLCTYRGRIVAVGDVLSSYGASRQTWFDRLIARCALKGIHWRQSVRASLLGN